MNPLKRKNKNLLLPNVIYRPVDVGPDDENYRLRLDAAFDILFNEMFKGIGDNPFAYKQQRVKTQ